MEPDGELLERFLNGDEGAFEDLVTRYETRIRNLAFGFLRDRGLAEDVAQESFLQAYRKAATLRDGGSFRSWLYRIAINRAQDELRRRARKSEVSIQEVMDLEGSGESVAETGVAMRQLEGALRKLRPDHRVALVLREVEGFSYREIAETLGCPLGTVQVRVHRARQELRDFMEGRQ